MNKENRKFEICSFYDDKGINLPRRATSKSAGYDFEAAEDVEIPVGFKPTLVPTGIRAKMNDDEVLMIFSRSSGPKKMKLVIPNSVGIIDADYYMNEDNEGHIYFQFVNCSDEVVKIKKGDKIGQGVFINHLVAETPFDETGVRKGGFGSTD